MGVKDLLLHAHDLFAGRTNPLASREEIATTGKKILTNLIAANLAKHKAARSKKGIADWTFSKEVAGIRVKYTDRLTYGNEKLKGIMIWDLPAVTTCPSCADCKDACYAVASQLLYPMTLYARWSNLLLYLLDPAWLEKRILSQLISRSRGYTSLRIHASGDFFDQEYADWWEGIVRYMKRQTTDQIRPYAYTKAEKEVDISGLEGQGVNFILSTLPDGSRNFTESKKPEGLGEAREIARRLAQAGVQAKICPATVSKGIKCGEKRWGGHCTWCLTHRHAIFVRH